MTSSISHEMSRERTPRAPHEAAGCARLHKENRQILRHVEFSEEARKHEE